jgi:3-oxoacyl-[acyl-carrier-protein] synthase-3
MDFAEVFGKENVQAIVDSTGIRERYVSAEEQTASDLCYVAAKTLMENKNIDPQTIGVLIFISPSPDYIMPASAFVLQKRLGLSLDCIAYDINLVCSSFIVGMQTMCSVLQGSSAKKGLLLIGDTNNKMMSPLDKSVLLFGNAGTAILVAKEQSEYPMRFGLKSDGNRFKSLIFPGGGFRDRNASRESVLWGDNNYRSDCNAYMSGTDVFNFTLRDVPEIFKEFSEYFSDEGDYDCLLLHQANGFIIKHIAKKLKISLDKVPLSLDRYGNTGGVSIPLTMCDRFGGKEKKTIHALASAFGVGLSWGVMSLRLNTDNIFPIIHTDDYYRDGKVSHG